MTTPEQIAPRSNLRRGRASSTVELGRAAHGVLDASPHAMTLRQLYYALVSTMAIPKTEPAYGKLKRLMRLLREDGTIPWGWLVDHTRSVFAPRTFAGIEGLLADSARLYRADLMRTQPVAIQVWAESDSIGSVIARTADRYCVPTFIGRGYSARGYLWSAARDAVAAHDAGKEVHILHVGDHDPSGEDIYRDVADTLRLYAAAVDIGWSVASTRQLMAESGLDAIDRTAWMSFERLALTPAQIDRYDLPYRPVKSTDVRSAGFRGAGAVEVEALPVAGLLAVVDDAIRSRIDVEALRAAELAEASERDIARRIAATPVADLLRGAA